MKSKIRQKGESRKTLLIKIFNNKGDKGPPWGTPDVTLNILDDTLNILTNCHLSVNHEFD